MPTTTVHLNANVPQLLNEGTWPARGADQLATHERCELLIHDLRSPLTAINGYAQLMQRRAASSQMAIAALMEGPQRIEAAATRIDALLDELERLTAFDSTHDPALRRQPTDVVQLARRAALASEAAGLGNCRVVVLSSVPELVGWWDAPRLERALANLIDNALKYNRDNRPVAVTVHRAEACAVISVADQGVGIPAAELARVFEHGYRASNVDRQLPGKGLGLVGVHDMVSEHGGALDLDSQIGIGTTVTLRLPLGALPTYSRDAPT